MLGRRESGGMFLLSHLLFCDGAALGKCTLPKAQLAISTALL